MALEQKEDNKRATHAQYAPQGEVAIALQTLESRPFNSCREHSAPSTVVIHN